MNDKQIVWVVFQDNCSCYGGDKLIAICSTEEKAMAIAETNANYFWDEMEIQ